VARPRLSDAERKHPHKPRRSTTTGVQYDIPEPSSAEKARWQWLVDLATNTVLSMPSRDGHKEKKLRITLTHTGKPPKGFPRGRLICINADGAKSVSYNCEFVLLFLWQMKLAPENASSLYEKRSKHINNMTRLENSAKIDVDKEYLSIYYEHLDSILNEILGE
jgi:putative transposon-encoded protein